MRTCEHCGISIEGKRANAKYCSTSCRVMASRDRGRARKTFPAEMTSAGRWVAWKPVLRRGRWSKMPIQANGSPASSTNPRTWTSFDAVKDFPRRGWVLGEGIGCIDLDGCITDGRVAGWAQKIIDEHRESAVWIEVSPSGTGVHVFLPMEPGRGRVIRDGRNIEVYPPDSGRYIAVTGEKFVMG